MHQAEGLLRMHGAWSMGEKSSIKDYLLLSFVFCLSPFTFLCRPSPRRLSPVAPSPRRPSPVARRPSPVAACRSPAQGSGHIFPPLLQHFFLSLKPFLFLYPKCFGSKNIMPGKSKQYASDRRVTLMQSQILHLVAH